jgi:arylsulfatase A-like enzyme
MKSKHLFLLLAVLLGFSAAAGAESLAAIFTNAAASAVPEKRASIMFIQCQGLAAADLSCYGQTNFQTPNLDRLAAEGVRFENFFGGADFSSGLAELMTGKKSVTNETTVAQRLQAAGYHTGLVGEWTLGAQPWTQGFDEFAGFLHDEEGRNYFADHVWRFAPKSIYDETNKTMTDFIGREMIHENTGGKKGRYLPEVLVNAMLNFERIHRADWANHFRPYFLLVNLPAPRSATAGADDFPVPSDAPFTGEKWPQAAKDRAALIMRIDGGIGRLFEQLQQSDDANNVVIFFSSSAAPEKFTDAKMNFLKSGGANATGSSLPMIVRWPQEIPAGRVSRSHWSRADFTPTALEIAHATPVKGLDGISILPTMRGQTQTNRLEKNNPAPK